MQRRIRKWEKMIVRTRMKKMNTAWKVAVGHALEIARARSEGLLERLGGGGKMG